MWLVDDEARNLRRPDRSRYVVDIMPDYIEAENNGLRKRIPVIQVWCDQKARQAWQDPALLDYLAKRSEREGCAVIVRYDHHEGFVLFPPAISEDGQWHRVASQVTGKAHSLVDILEGEISTVRAAQ